jgi:hypothetical protein
MPNSRTLGARRVSKGWGVTPTPPMRRIGEGAFREENPRPWGSAKIGTLAGRPSVLTPDTPRRLAELRAGGRTVGEAARVLGISRRSAFRALAAARAPAGSADLQAFLAWGEPGLVAQIARAAAGDWRAAAWLLERRWPERWGRPESRSESLSVRQ